MKERMTEVKAMMQEEKLSKREITYGGYYQTAESAHFKNLLHFRSNKTIQDNASSVGGKGGIP